MQSERVEQRAPVKTWVQAAGGCAHNQDSGAHHANVHADVQATRACGLGREHNRVCVVLRRGERLLEQDVLVGLESRLYECGV